jgi:Rrf2 family protein
MQISRKSDYALRAMIYVSAWEDDKICSINEISEAEQVPREYLAKILKELSLQGFLHSYKGIHGGYRLARRREDVTFLNIIEAMQGKVAINECMRNSGSGGCSRELGCAMHSFWQTEQDRIVKALGSIGLSDMDYEKFYPFARSKRKKQAVHTS